MSNVGNLLFCSFTTFVDANRTRQLPRQEPRDNMAQMQSHDWLQTGGWDRTLETALDWVGGFISSAPDEKPLSINSSVGHDGARTTQLCVRRHGQPPSASSEQGGDAPWSARNFYSPIVMLYRVWVVGYARSAANRHCRLGRPKRSGELVLPFALRISDRPVFFSGTMSGRVDCRVHCRRVCGNGKLTVDFSDRDANSSSGAKRPAPF